MDILVENGLIDSEKNTKVFNEFTLISLYGSEKWNGIQIPRVNMWSFVGYKWFSIFETTM